MKLTPSQCFVDKDYLEKQGLPDYLALKISNLVNPSATLPNNTTRDAKKIFEYFQGAKELSPDTLTLMGGGKITVQALLEHYMGD